MRFFFQETIDAKDKAPLTQLLTELGGWPVLGDKDGGSWSDIDFDLEVLMGRVSSIYNKAHVISSYVDVDDRDSSRHLVYVRNDLCFFWQ